MSSNIIRDGYTREGYIAADDGRYDALTFEYRPLLAEEVEKVEAYVAINSQKDPVKTAHVVAANVARQLTKWSEVDRETKKPEPSSFENVRRLPFPVLNRLYRVIAGLQASDLKPGTEEAKATDYGDELLAEVSGRPPVAAEETAAKN